MKSIVTCLAILFLSTSAQASGIKVYGKQVKEVEQTRKHKKNLSPGACLHKKRPSKRISADRIAGGGRHKVYKSREEEGCKY